MSFDVTTFTPSGGALVQSSPIYRDLVAQFARAANIITTNTRPTVEPDLDIRDAQVRSNVIEFLKWTRTFSTGQWKQGVPLNKTSMFEACGHPHHLGHAALRACLVKVRSGNRKKGEPNIWTLSAPHLQGLAMFLARAAARDAALAAQEMEAIERQAKLEAELDDLLASGPSQYELDYQATEQLRLQVLQKSREERALPHVQRLRASGTSTLKVNIGTRDMEPLSEDAPENWAKLEQGAK